MNAIATFRQAYELTRQGLTEEQVAVRLGITQGTVSKHLALRNVEEKVMQTFGGVKAPLSFWSEIARHPPDVQRAAIGDICKQLMRRGRIGKRDVAKILALRGRDLDLSPFPTKACAACYDRTGAQPDFFGDVDRGHLGRCLRAACFARHLNAVAARRVRNKKNKKNKKNRKK